MSYILIPQCLDEYGSKFHPDEVLLHVTINDLFGRHPEKFGSAEIHHILQQEIKEGMANALAVPSEKRTILPLLGALFSTRGLQPLSGISLAFLACNDRTYNDMESLRSSLGLFTDLDPKRTEALNFENAIQCASNGRYDYVLTGNVLNDPKLQFYGSTVPVIQTGIANMLKKGGLAIHGLNYSGDHYDQIIDKTLLKFIGQEVQQQINPRGNYELLIDALILSQKEEVSISPRRFQWMESAGALFRPPEYLPETSSYFAMNPEALDQINYDRFVWVGRKKNQRIERRSDTGEIVATYTPDEFQEWLSDFKTQFQSKKPSPLERGPAI